MTTTLIGTTEFYPLSLKERVQDKIERGWRGKLRNIVGPPKYTVPTRETVEAAADTCCEHATRSAVDYLDTPDKRWSGISIEYRMWTRLLVFPFPPDGVQ